MKYTTNYLDPNKPGYWTGTDFVEITPADVGKVLGIIQDENGNPTYGLVEGGGGSGGGMSDDAKDALITLLEKVAYTDEHGQEYLDNLADALGGRSVSSISAVFTQGQAVIYDTDSLDELKAYLVVTAYYSDGTDAVLEDSYYSLRGTLECGEASTITASYRGKSATFVVDVAYRYIITAGSPNVSFGSYDLSTAAPTYKSNTNTNRISCLGEDLLGYRCEYGYTYHFVATGNAYSSMQIAVAYLNETAKAAVEQRQNGDAADRKNSGFMSTPVENGVDITPTETLNGSAPAFMWFALRKDASDTNFNTLSNMGTITITRTALTD